MSHPSGGAVGKWPLRRVLCSGQGGALTESFGLSPEELVAAVGFLEAQNVTTLSSLSCCSEDDLTKAFVNCYLSLGQKAMIRGVAAKARSLMEGSQTVDAPGKDVAATGAAAAASHDCDSSQSTVAPLSPRPQRPAPQPAAQPAGPPARPPGGQDSAPRWREDPLGKSDPWASGKPGQSGSSAQAREDPLGKSDPWASGRPRQSGSSAQARDDPLGTSDPWASGRPGQSGSSAKARDDPLAKSDPWASRRPGENSISAKAPASWSGHPGDEPSPATGSRAGASGSKGGAPAAGAPAGGAEPPSGWAALLGDERSLGRGARGSAPAGGGDRGAAAGAPAGGAEPPSGWAALLGDERSLGRGARGGAPAGGGDRGAAAGAPAGRAEAPSGWAELLGDGRPGRSAAAGSHREGSAGGGSAPFDWTALLGDSRSWDGSRREVLAAKSPLTADAPAKKKKKKKKASAEPGQSTQGPATVLSTGAHDFKSQLNSRFGGKGITYEVRSDGRNCYARVRVAEHGFFTSRQSAETKKGAEQLAARAALHALGFEQSSGTEFAGVRDVDASADDLYRRIRGMTKEQRMQVAEQEAIRLFDLFPPDAKLVLGNKGAKHLLQYKVHLCPEYERGRTCWRKKYCTFAHGYDEMLQCSVAERIRAAGRAMLELGAERFWEQAVEAAESLNAPGGAASGAQRGAERHRDASPPRAADARRGEDPWQGGSDPWGVGAADPRQRPWDAAPQGGARPAPRTEPLLSTASPPAPWVPAAAAVGPSRPPGPGGPAGAAAPAEAGGKGGGRGGGKGQGKQSREDFRREALEVFTKALLGEAESDGVGGGALAVQELWLDSVGGGGAGAGRAGAPAADPAAPTDQSWPSWQEIEATCRVMDDAQSGGGEESDGEGDDDDDDISSEDFEEPAGRGPAGPGLLSEYQ